MNTTKQNIQTESSKYPCPYAKKCGGCSLMNLSYEEQLALKQKRVISLLGRFGHVEPIVKMDDPTHYRCKTQYAFYGSGKTLKCGVYQSDSHRIVPIDKCLIDDPVCDRIAMSFRRLASDFNLSSYNDRDRSGLLRHIQIRRGYFTGEIMLIIVTGTFSFPHKKAFVEKLVKFNPEITTIIQNINNKFTSMVLGDKNEILFGPGYIRDKIEDLQFKISPGSFYQVNPQMTVKLYGCVREFLKPSGRDNILDAYSGTGTIGLFVSAHVNSVTGVELVKSAVFDAKENAIHNSIGNSHFFCDDAGRYLMRETGKRHFDAVIMDPPRSGSSREFLVSVVKGSPKRIVYVSCNPETLRRDLDFLTKNNYKVEKIRPHDMFPYTDHVETVVTMARV